MKVCSVAEMRAMDRLAVEKYGIPEEILMENAGLAAFTVLANQFNIGNKRFLVVCGSGNNGGDGLVVARKLHSHGGQVKVILVGEASKYSGAAKSNYEIASRLPIEMHHLSSLAELAVETASCDIIIDAIFGTGLMRAIEGVYREVIETINQSGKWVLSLDIPSGVAGDTGKVLGAAIKANATVTFGLPKYGNLLYPGYALGGELYVSHISFPPAMYTIATMPVEISPMIKLPARERDAHKGSVGKALFIAGAGSYYGAPYFSALSFLKAGGGYSRLAAPKSMVPFLANRGSEIVFIPQQETPAGSLALANKPALLELANSMDIVILGPGLSLQEETQQLVRELARVISRPLIIDADGISAVARDLDVIRSRAAETVLTPHLAEMAKITGLTIEEIDSNRIEVLRRTTQDLNAFIVLKGAHSLIGCPDGRIFINPSGNPGMATAGTGDVLNGAIAAMYGLGLPLAQAVIKGVFLHGFAGDLAAEDKGEDGITAQDVLETLPYALKLERQGLDDKWLNRYALLKII